MAPVLPRTDTVPTDDPTLIHTSGVAWNMLLVFTVLFFTSVMGGTAYWMFKCIRQRQYARAAKADLEARKGISKHSRGGHSISIPSEKSAFLIDTDTRTPSPTESIPEIRLHFPEEQSPDGKRQSRVVTVKVSDKGSVGYEPYQEPLPVYQEKESPLFQSVDLESIGGLKEKDLKA